MKQAGVKNFFVICIAVIIGIFPISSYAATVSEIDASVNASIERFVNEVKGAKSF